MYKKIFVSSDLADGGRAVLHRFHTQSLRHRHGQVVGPHPCYMDMPWTGHVQQYYQVEHHLNRHGW